MNCDFSIEVWRNVDFLPYIDVSDLGNIRSYRVWRNRMSDVPKPMKTPLVHGYRSIYIKNPDGSRRSITIAILVAHAFLGPRPEGMVVAHENGIRTDDRMVNLSYKTQMENIHDKFRHGTVIIGENHVNHKLSNPAVGEIRTGSLSINAAARKFGVSPNAIWQVRKGITWKHL